MEARLNIRRLVKPLLLGVVMPISSALLLDLALATLPIATIAAIVICMPLGGFWLGRTVLQEFDRVIEEVAPEETDGEAGEEAPERIASPVMSDGREQAQNHSIFR